MEKSFRNLISGLPNQGRHDKQKVHGSWLLPIRNESTDNCYECNDPSLFSTSMPGPRDETFNFVEFDQTGESFDDGLPNPCQLCIEDEVIDPFADITLKKMGNLLPGDEDELFAGLVNDFDFSELPTQIEDLEDDIFGSGGGMEIEHDNQDYISNGISSLRTSNGIGPQYGIVNIIGAVTGEHPYGEHPSRTLFVRNINSNVEDSELKLLFEHYGDIRTLYTACKPRGFVMISYYDIRAARTAMRALQNKPLRRRKLDIHFSIPKDNPSEKDVNQGTLVVFNLDASVSNDDLRKIFGVYGEVKEIRETPHKRHHKFIEYYDIRAAEAALKALNKCDIAGKRIKLEPSRPGGARRSLIQQLSQEQDQDEARSFRHHTGSPIANSPPGSWPNLGSPIEHYPLHNHSQMPCFKSLSPVGSNHFSGLASVLPSPISKPVKIAPIGKDPGNIIHANSAPNVNVNLNVGSASTFSESKASSIETLSGPEFLWGSPTHMEQNKTSVQLSLTGNPIPLRRQGSAFPYTTQRNSFLGSHLLVGSAPPVIPLEKHFGFFPASPETSCINQGIVGAQNFGQSRGNHLVSVGNSSHFRAYFAGNFSESGFPNSRMMPISEKGSFYFGNGTFGSTCYDGIVDHGRIRRADSGNQIDNKKQYQLDLEKIVNGEDNRTTLMIKNIPNKYNSKMLLAAIDETHAGTYDFIYLPIDFKNKCNVGYAFINMTSPSHIISFYEAFNGKKWEKFNSEKVASLAYARIQGKAALIMHFQNSSLMNEDKHCRPIVFQSEGQGDNELEHLPSGNLNILIHQPDGSYAGDSLDSPTSDLEEQL